MTLLTTSALTKQGDGSYLGTVTITNQGTGSAQNVQLTGATLGPAAGAVSSNVIGNLAPGSTASLTVTYPASAGASGTTVAQRYAGSYAGGTFGSGLRSLLP